jgi:hypothetical protein
VRGAASQCALKAKADDELPVEVAWPRWVLLLMPLLLPLLLLRSSSEAALEVAVEGDELVGVATWVPLIALLAALSRPYMN